MRTEETSPNGALPTFSGAQLEASHELIVVSLVETAERTTATEAAEETQLYQKNLQQAIDAENLQQAENRIWKKAKHVC